MAQVSPHLEAPPFITRPSSLQTFTGATESFPPFFLSFFFLSFEAAASVSGDGATLDLDLDLGLGLDLGLDLDLDLGLDLRLAPSAARESGFSGASSLLGTVWQNLVGQPRTQKSGIGFSSCRNDRGPEEMRKFRFDSVSRFLDSCWWCWRSTVTPVGADPAFVAGFISGIHRKLSSGSTYRRNLTSPFCCVLYVFSSHQFLLPQLFHILGKIRREKTDTGGFLEEEAASPVPQSTCGPAPTLHQGALPRAALVSQQVTGRASGCHGEGCRNSP